MSTPISRLPHCLAIPTLTIAFAALGLFLHSRANAQPSKSASSSATMPSTIANAPFRNPDLPIDKRVDDLVSRMTLNEKIGQMLNDSPAIERLGLPAYGWWNECLHGVAGPGFSTVFPQAIGLGATFHTDLLREVAVCISDEARAKHHEFLRTGDNSMRVGLTFWSPNVNIFRDPRWGRGQETYGEDPYLTARLGVEFVEGLQGDDPKYLKLVSTPKHYAVHSGPEPERYRFNAKVDDRNLYETYLPHFEDCVREAKAYSVMCAYSAINGEPCCSNTRILEDILRKDWGFEGYVVSDCGAIRNIYNDHKTVATAEEASARALLAGCDLNCGNTYLALDKAVKQGLVTEKDIDKSLKRLFTARFKLGMFDPPERVAHAQIPFSVVDSEPHRKLALKTARESMVLLKNDGLLPLSKDLKTVAVIGPNADDKDVLHGNYNGTSSYAITPLEGIKRAVSPKTKVLYAKGCDLQGFSALEPIPSANLLPADGAKGANGLAAEYFNNENLQGEPALKRIDANVDFAWEFGAPAPGIGKDHFSIRWTGKLIAPLTGDYVIGTTTDDGVRLSLDGKSLIHDWSEHAAQTATSRVRLEAGKEYSIQMEFYDRLQHATAKLVWAPPAAVDRLKLDAVAAAKQADVSILVLGISQALEGETYDRHFIELPKPQEELLKAVVAVGKPVAVVILSGSMVATEWADAHVPAILEAWYPGQEGGTAVADVLFGNYNPGGRLPVTVYRSLDQVPLFEDYNVAAGRTYKYFDGDPLYPFGYGLSYTKFKYKKLNVTPSKITPGETLTVSVSVTNTGKMAGDEVVQLYLTREDEQELRNGAGDPLVPIRELQGFRRVSLNPGETKNVEFTLSPKQFARVNEQGRMVVEPGRVLVSVGGGQPGVKKRSGGQVAEPLYDEFEVVGLATLID